MFGNVYTEVKSCSVFTNTKYKQTLIQLVIIDKSTLTLAQLYTLTNKQESSGLQTLTPTPTNFPSYFPCTEVVHFMYST